MILIFLPSTWLHSTSQFNCTVLCSTVLCSTVCAAGLLRSSEPPAVALSAASVFLDGDWRRRSAATSAPTMYFFTSLLTFWLPLPHFRIPKSSQIGITFKVGLMQRFPLFRIYSRPSADQKRGHLLHLGSKSGLCSRQLLKFTEREKCFLFFSSSSFTRWVLYWRATHWTLSRAREQESEKLRFSFSGTYFCDF